MPVQQTIPLEEGAFFITFTCHRWLNLIEITNSYDLIYKSPSDRHRGRSLIILKQKDKKLPVRLLDLVMYRCWLIL